MSGTTQGGNFVHPAAHLGVLERNEVLPLRIFEYNRAIAEFAAARLQCEETTQLLAKSTKLPYRRSNLGTPEAWWNGKKIPR